MNGHVSKGRPEAMHGAIITFPLVKGAYRGPVSIQVVQQILECLPGAMHPIWLVFLR